MDGHRVTDNCLDGMSCAPAPPPPEDSPAAPPPQHRTPSPSESDDNNPPPPPSTADSSMGGNNTPFLNASKRSAELVLPLVLGGIIQVFSFGFLFSYFV